MSTSRLPSWRGVARAFDGFFFSPLDTRACAVLRIGVAVCVIVELLVLSGDLERWFGEGGVLPLAASRGLVDPHALSPFEWLPASSSALRIAFGLALGQAVLLLLGIWPRFQALGLLIWLQAFQVRNMLILDGSGIVLRTFAFYLVFMPSANAFSVPAWLARRRGAPLACVRPAWGLVLLRFQMGLIYVGSAWEKLNGSDWIDGSALYYVSRLDDNFSHGPILDSVFSSLAVCRFLTWGTLAIEILLPILLWFAGTRRLGILLGVLFHLALGMTMNLFLFPWVMIIGLLAFLETDDFERFARWRRNSSSTR
ncbi:MAG: HTTM domain-containing protein [Planctomycetota bacterium]